MPNNTQPTVSVEVGNDRLLALAYLLQDVPERHGVTVGTRQELRGYSQSVVLFPCGSPACAWGHWTIAAQERLQKEIPSGGCPFTRTDGTAGRWLGIEYAEKEFHLSPHEVDQLFSTHGCGRANTGAEAAAYIRQFVRNRQEGSV